MITYLLGLNTNAVGEVLFWLVASLTTAFFIITNLLFITLAVECVVVIGYPYRHRSIMTTKVVRGMVIATWVVSAIAAANMIVFAPHPIMWPFGTMFASRGRIRLITLVPLRFASAAFIVAVNVFLYYKVRQSNKKAEENMRTGSAGQEETSRLNKLVKKLRSQTKTAITLLLLGGIDGIANVLIPLIHIVVISKLGPTGRLYAVQFLSYTLQSCVPISHSLVYGFYMKQIRQRLPQYNICRCLHYPRHSRVIVLNQSS